MQVYQTFIRNVSNQDGSQTKSLSLFVNSTVNKTVLLGTTVPSGTAFIVTGKYPLYSLIILFHPFSLNGIP